MSGAGLAPAGVAPARIAPARTTSVPLAEPDGGKIRREAHCERCGRPRWGVFAWRGDEGVFTCNDGHATPYVWTGDEWRPL